jgi:hypothetical protein
MCIRKKAYYLIGNAVKNLLTFTLIMIVSFALYGCVIHVGNNSDANTDTFTRTLTLSTDQINQLDIIAKQGDVEIIGLSDTKTIEVEARIKKTDDRSFTFNLSKLGDTAYLVSHFDNTTNGWSFGSQYIDLTVYVPNDLLLKMEQRSGDLRIKNLNNDLVLDDTSGDITLFDISGNIELRDNSGDITIKRTQGDINIVDRSGDVDIYNTAGNVTIEDRSGDINVKTAMSLTVLDDGSGDIAYDDIQNGVNIAQ